MIDQVCNDLIAEQHALDAVVAPLPPAAWLVGTPSPGWTIADQVGHLTYFDRTAALAITDPDRFIAHRRELVAQMTSAAKLDDATLDTFRQLDSNDQLDDWRAARAELEQAASDLGDDDRVEWYGPSMGAKSFLTARLMEVWAHGQDIVDGLNRHGHQAHRPDSDRLRHIAQLGFITRRWSYTVRGAKAPDVAVRVELSAPSGTTWRFGDDTASEVVSGPAVDFCRVVTQRRHVDDTALTTTGAAARSWMEIAQAFAGSPTVGPPAGSFSEDDHNGF